MKTLFWLAILVLIAVVVYNWCKEDDPALPAKNKGRTIMKTGNYSNSFLSTDSSLINGVQKKISFD